MSRHDLAAPSGVIKPDRCNALGPESCTVWVCKQTWFVSAERIEDDHEPFPLVRLAGSPGDLAELTLGALCASMLGWENVT